MKTGFIKTASPTALGALLPALAAKHSRKAAGKGYQTLSKKDPPKNPEAPDVTWKEAVVWSIVVGALGGIARVATRKGLTSTPIPANGERSRRAKMKYRSRSARKVLAKLKS